MVNLLRKIIFSLFMATALFVFPFLSAAEENEEAGDDSPHELEVSAKYDVRSDARSQPGSIAIAKSDYSYQYDFKAFDKLPVEFSLYNRYTSIDSTVSNVHLPGRLIELTTGIETTMPFFNFNNTYFRIGLEPSFYSDSWNFTAASFRIPSYYYAIYRPNPKWIFLCGIYVVPGTQNPILPIPGIIYKPNDRLTFYLAPRRPNIEYALTKKISVFWEGSFFVDNEYEVKFDDTRNAVLRFYETYTGGGIKYKPNKFVEASLSAGGNFWRRFTYDDSLGKVNMKNSAYTQFRVTVTP